MDLDPFNEQHYTYPICNIYYDTEDSALIRRSLSKPKYKEKLRLRGYDTPSDFTKVFLEIKKKVRGLVNKRRSTLILTEALEFIKTHQIPQLNEYMNPQVLTEIEYVLNNYALKPQVFVGYQRRAFFGKNDSDIRVSFDVDIITRRTHLDLRKGFWGEKLIDDSLTLMEVKVANAIPLWMSKLLSEYQIFSTSFSKYGMEYKKHLHYDNLINLFAS